MPGIAGFKKGFKKLFNFVKKSDEKNKKHIIEDENRITIIQNNKLSKECENPKVGNEKSTTGTENVSIGKNISSLEEVKESQLNKKNELVVNHDGNIVLGKEDDTLQNSYTTLLDNGKDETCTKSVIDNKTKIDDFQQQENSANNTTKPTAVVKPCQKIEVVDPPLETNEDSLKKLSSNKNCELSEESKTTETQDREIDIKHCEVKEEINVEHEVIHTKELKSEEDIIEIDLKIKSVNKEQLMLREEIKVVEASNMQMMIIVEEFEKTINQLMEEKEREEVCQQIILDRILNEKEDIVRDHKNVERAFGDLTDKYERARNIVPGLKICEDKLKESVDELSARYDAEEKNYSNTKIEAENKLVKAEDTLENNKKAKSMEIAKLTAQLRKTEMSISSLEKEIDQKNQENRELATMCDDLLARLEKS